MGSRFHRARHARKPPSPNGTLSAACMVGLRPPGLQRLGWTIFKRAS
jgi:hypothetical protein